MLLADAKTHLRELSVLHGIRYLNTQRTTELTPINFLEECKGILNTDISVANNILDIDEHNFCTIKENGYKLARLILEKLPNINGNSKLLWVGNQENTVHPKDIVIDDYEISLKEDSYILENMGMYKFLNYLTGSNFSSGQLHGLEDFAKKEHEDWFQYAWNKFIRSANGWHMQDKKGKISTVTIQDLNATLSYDGKIQFIPNALDITFCKFSKLVPNKIIEKTFSKWIKENLDKDEAYTQLKKKCAETAGEKIVNLLNQKIQNSREGLMKLLRIYPQRYYYGKTTGSTVELLKIPAQNEFDNVFEIVAINFKVPKSQLNIYTTVRNKNTQEELVFRNEIRYTHGQLNGKPEAKLYYERGNNISVIYGTM